MANLPFVKGHITQCPLQHATLPSFKYMLIFMWGYLYERETNSCLDKFHINYLDLFSAVIIEHVTISLLMIDT